MRPTRKPNPVPALKNDGLIRHSAAYRFWHCTILMMLIAKGLNHIPMTTAWNWEANDGYTNLRCNQQLMGATLVTSGEARSRLLRSICLGCKPASAREVIHKQWTGSATMTIKPIIIVGLTIALTQPTMDHWITVAGGVRPANRSKSSFTARIEVHMFRFPVKFMKLLLSHPY